MPVRQNLCIRPACKNSSTNWSGPSGWARITGADASLPRTTAFAGTNVGDIATPRFACTAGLNYVGSVSIYFIAASVGNLNVDWYAAGGTYLSTSSGPGFNYTGGTTARVSTGVALAPANAVEGLVNIAGIDGSAQITAVLVEQTGATGGAYFDGDSVNAIWDGTNGSSTSTETTSNPISAVGTFTVRGFVAGIRESFGSALGTFSVVGATGLITTAAYDDTRGRVRISASGLTVTVVRAVVERRKAGTQAWTEIRGGRVAVAGNRFIRTVDDYEYASGGIMEYRITAYSTQEGQPPVVVQSAIIPVDLTAITQAWLKVIAAPYLNRKITVTGWGTIARPARNALFDVVGRRDPVAVTDVHGSRRVEVTLRTWTLEEGDALDEALGRGIPIYLHTARSSLPSMYAVVDGYGWDSLRNRSPGRKWTVPIIEVTAPPLSVVGAGTTWQTVITSNATWADVLTRYPTWAEVIA